MKARILILLAVISFVFTACDLTSESNYRPDIVFMTDPVINGGDTLSVFYTDQAGVYRLDTITVGDTVNFKVYVNAYENNIQSFFMTQSADSVTDFILPSVNSMDSLFLPTSNYNEGKFYMGGQANSLYFPFQYVAKKASLEAKISFSVVSDANFEYNQNSFVLKTPIVAAPDTIQ